ncbi:hypothetical protein BpHYR1_004837 [Brachionus plicatilis]|uniref:Uncharacterized protein n=1 Tax=Brachionus plicatilis TaxID=10195 RepID=A0A3M7QLU4_BRAPC|nr:hypothetical protein BpHYR1_004837 [Brachionus plicatilis]
MLLFTCMLCTKLEANYSPIEFYFLSKLSWRILTPNLDSIFDSLPFQKKIMSDSNHIINQSEISLTLNKKCLIVLARSSACHLPELIS